MSEEDFQEDETVPEEELEAKEDTEPDKEEEKDTVTDDEKEDLSKEKGKKEEKKNAEDAFASEEMADLEFVPQKTTAAALPKLEKITPDSFEPEEKEKESDAASPNTLKTKIFALRTNANREDQVMTFLVSNAERKKIEVFSVIRPHGMRGYIFLEAATKSDAEQAAFGVPYARGILEKEIEYKEIEHMLEQVKKEANIKKNDIAEIISGPFKREKCKITRVDKAKEEVVVELLEAAVPIPISLKLDAVKVIRRDSDEEEAAE